MTHLPTEPYVHGYTPRESQRLRDQADTLVEVLHGGLTFAPGSRLLEAGCGVGAQTVTLAARHPGVQLVAVDRDPTSLEGARAALRAAGHERVTLVHADLTALPFADATFDHAFVCFVLEHVSDPVALLRGLLRVVRPGGALTVIEGDHGSAFFHPDHPDAHHAIECLVTLQARGGGDARIGRRLYPVLRDAGLADIAVEPRPVYADASRPATVQGFTLATFTAMVEGVGPAALAAGLTDPERWSRGLAALRRCAADDGTFSYTFFRGRGRRP
jgi:SAM-dependent methyltransferase